MNIRSRESAVAAATRADGLPGVRDSGGTGTPIVLLHGFLSSSSYWNRVRPLLVSSGYRVIAIDLLGFGGAPKPRGSRYGYREHLAHLDSVLTRLKLTVPVVLVGHSMGALLAARFARLHESRVESLILLHPPLYRDVAEARATLRQTGRVYRFLLDSRHRQLGWRLVRAVRLPGVSRHTQVSRERSLLNLVELSEIFTDLRSMQTPTLLVIGLRDRPVYGANLERASLSDQVTTLSSDVSHHSPLTRPAWVRDTVIRFAQGQQPRHSTSSDAAGMGAAA